ncbi:MAG: hypothetical protein J0I06_20145 [Planctomycetes bacterium]|nr:hypothetical protein [Planctomycetota bacterium]
MCVEVAEDELGRLEQPAGGLDLPDLAEPAPTEALDQPVALQRAGQFFLADQANRHD